MKKVIMILVMFAMMAMGRTGFGNTYVKYVQMYNSGHIDIITSTRPNGVGAFRITSNHPMKKIWLAAIMNAYNNGKPVYIYYNENPSTTTPTIDKLEMK